LAGAGGDSVAVGKHQAVQLIDNQWGGCAVIVGISADASAIVVGAPNVGSAAEGCPYAVSTAKIIDPKLP
jgi:hypothetical protein